MDERWDRLVELWWIRLPQAVRRIAVRPVLVLVDGLFLTAWPKAAAILPPLVLLIGLLCGALHPGFGEAFSESWLVLILALFLGVFSGHLGAMFWLGYVFGDFFLFHREWTLFGSFPSHLVRVRIPLLIEYGLLAFMATGIALGTKGLLAQLRPPQSLSRQVRFLLAVAGHFFLTLVFVYLWMQVVPILIRPLFTWPYGTPPVAAMAILQQQGWPLLLVAGVASLARMGLQQVIANNEAQRATLDWREQQLNGAEPVSPLSARIPAFGRVALTSVWSTLMLAGMMEAWWDGLILLAVITVLQLARARVLPVDIMTRWAGFVTRIPFLLRLAVGLAVTSFVARIALGPALLATNSFRPILLLTIFALLVFYLLDPLREEARPAAT